MTLVVVTLCGGCVSTSPCEHLLWHEWCIPSSIYQWFWLTIPTPISQIPYHTYSPHDFIIIIFQYSFSSSQLFHSSIAILKPLSYHSVDKTIANHPFKNCYLYHLFMIMVKLWMVYYCFNNIFRIANTTVFLGLETQADPHPRDLELLRLDFSVSAEALRPGMIWKRKDII